MKKWKKKDADGMSIIASATPRPFPGKTPTRVAWEVRFQDGTKQTYLGKPSATSYQRFRKLVLRPGMNWYRFREFDRASVIAEITDLVPVPIVRFTRRNGRLCIYYKPDTVWTHIPGSTRFYSHRIGRRWIYSPLAVLPAANRTAYTNWLSAEGLS